jgi:hypothetical protein
VIPGTATLRGRHRGTTPPLAAPASTSASALHWRSTRTGDQLAAEVLYVDVDADGKELDGDRSYVLYFPAGRHPPASVLWNLGLYDADMLVVENEIGR